VYCKILKGIKFGTKQKFNHAVGYEGHQHLPSSNYNQEKQVQHHTIADNGQLPGTNSNQKR
jgi:hypothetical protein